MGRHTMKKKFLKWIMRKFGYVIFNSEDIFEIISQVNGRRNSTCIHYEEDSKDLDDPRPIKKISIYRYGEDPNMGYIRTFRSGMAEEHIIRDALTNLAHSITPKKR